MHILVVGTGVIGTVYGAHLGAANHRVSVLAHGERTAAFAVGIVLFSGSLYALALGAPRWVGIVTPFGGIAFVAGWLALGWTLRPRHE